MTAADIVQGQLDAYNAREVDAFARFYADDVRGTRIGDGTVRFDGIAALRAVYAKAFENRSVHATLVQRMVLGNRVIDQEHITGLGADPVEAAVMFDFENGLIRRVWFAETL